MLVHKRIMKAQTNTGELVRRAERKEKPSTLKPDADNAAVGSDKQNFLQEAPNRLSPVFVLQLKMQGSLL